MTGTPLLFSRAGSCHWHVSHFGQENQAAQPLLAGLGWAEEDPGLGEPRAQEPMSWQTAQGKLSASLQPGCDCKDAFQGKAASWELSQH